MQSKSELRVHPVDLSEFGLTPYGDSVYRVVWADSRKSVAYKGGKKITTSKYQHGVEAELKGKWILEKHLPAEKVYGMDAETWYALQQSAPQQHRLTPEQDREANRFLDILPQDMRAVVEKKLTPPQRGPIIEPYSAEGDYEFAGLYFVDTVDESYLKSQIRGSIYRMLHTTEADRAAEEVAKEEMQERENEEKFDAIWDGAREASLLTA